MNPTMLARLRAAIDFVLDELKKGTDAQTIVDRLAADHGATYRTGASTNSLRCAGVAATCTWSRNTGLLDAWRKNAVVRIATENAA